MSEEYDEMMNNLEHDEAREIMRDTADLIHKYVKRDVAPSLILVAMLRMWAVGVVCLMPPGKAALTRVLRKMENEIHRGWDDLDRAGLR